MDFETHQKQDLDGCLSPAVVVAAGVRAAGEASCDVMCDMVTAVRRYYAVAKRKKKRKLLLCVGPVSDR